MQRQKSKGIFLASGDGIDTASHVHAISQEQATTMKTLHELCLDTMHRIPNAAVESSSHTPPHMVLDDPACRYVWLRARESDQGAYIDLEFWPGDGLTQARALFGALKFGVLQSLVSSGEWSVVPQIRFSHFRKGLYGCEPDIALDEFCTYWSAHIEFLQQIRRGDDAFVDIISWLHETDMIGAQDMDQLYILYRDTKRDHMNVFPRLHLRRTWEAAHALADPSQFAKDVGEAIAQAQSCWAASNLG